MDIHAKLSCNSAPVDTRTHAVHIIHASMETPKEVALKA